METTELRDFRRSWRRFERISGAQVRNCCRIATLAQCLVLLESDEAGPHSVSQLAARLRLDASTLSRTIDGLVKQRLMERRRDGDDRRVVWVALTAKGKAACREIHRDNDALCLRVFDKIPASKLGSVLSNFDTLVQAFLDCEAESKEVAP